MITLYIFKNQNDYSKDEHVVLLLIYSIAPLHQKMCSQ